MDFKITNNKFATTADSSGFWLSAGVVDNFMATQVNIGGRRITIFSCDETFICQSAFVKGDIVVGLRCSTGSGFNTTMLKLAEVEQLDVKDQYELKAILDEALNAISDKLVDLNHVGL